MEDIHIRKSKKEKKQKRHHEEALVELSEPIDLDSLELPKKEKKKKHKESNEEPCQLPTPAIEQEVETDKLKKEKKLKKHKREVIDLDALEPVECEPSATSFTSETPSKKEKKKKRKETCEESAMIHEEPEPTEIPIRTPSKRENASTAESHSSDKWGANSESYEELTGGAKYWKRIDEGKWKEKVTGTKYEKVSHYDKGGDAWGNEAADILGKVKGKGFVKAMQKLKRASWKGQGSLDTGVNSVQFSDWED